MLLCWMSNPFFSALIAVQDLIEPELLEQEVGLLGPDLQIGKVGRCDLDLRIQPDGSGLQQEVSRVLSGLQWLLKML